MGWCEVIVHLDALEHNIQLVRKRVPGKLYAVVKSNAYGHGVLECSRVFLDGGADGLALFFPEEVFELKSKGIDAPEFLLLGGFLPGKEHLVVEGGMVPAVGDWWMLDVLEKAAQSLGVSVPVHVKLDTGMGRLGFLPEDWERLRNRLKKLKRVKCVGVMSHFPVADEKGKKHRAFTLNQIELFKEAISLFEDIGVEVFHICNSAGVFFYPQALLGGARVGIALYGGLEGVGLKQAMEVRTRILSVKTVPPGWSISYGRTYISEGKKRVGIIPVGYATGFSRKFSNKAQVSVKSKRCAVLGRVCMDLTVIDLEGTDAREGDWVYLLGGEGRITVFECASWMDTISYEVFCLFSLGAKRFIYCH